MFHTIRQPCMSSSGISWNDWSRPCWWWHHYDLVGWLEANHCHCRNCPLQLDDLYEYRHPYTSIKRMKENFRQPPKNRECKLILSKLVVKSVRKGLLTSLIQISGWHWLEHSSSFYTVFAHWTSERLLLIKGSSKVTVYECKWVSEMSCQSEWEWRTIETRTDQIVLSQSDVLKSCRGRTGLPTNWQMSLQDNRPYWHDNYFPYTRAALGTCPKFEP